ncbi:GtrA family protein [bacterium]|nr:GtrA family protein [bacterium]
MIYIYDLFWGKVISNKLFRFLVVGVVTFVMYYALLSLLYSYMHIVYWLAIAVSYVISVVFHYLSNRSYTFRASGSRIGGQLLKYVVMAAMNYIIQLIAVFVLYEVIGVWFYYAVVVGTALTFIVGYVLMRGWVFRDNQYSVR